MLRSRHLYIALNRPAIAPLGESLSNSEIFRRLAAAMGYTNPCFRESDEEVPARGPVAAQTHERFAGITGQRLLNEGFARTVAATLASLCRRQLCHAQRQM